MSKNVERTINATLTARELPGGAWQLSSIGQAGVDIILRGTDPDARADLTVTLTTAGGTRQLRARTVILHESRTLLYDGLPLVRLDDAARRFWRRVFWLVRIPGGRRLLGLVARRSGGAK